jgi:hypothetical protein
MKFEDIAGPLDCPEGTIQDDCEELMWLSTRPLFECDAGDAGPPAVDGGTSEPPRGGCCNAAGRVAGDLIAGLVVLLILYPMVIGRRTVRATAGGQG